MSEFKTIAAVQDIPENTAKLCVVDDTDVLVCRSAGEFYAVENRCSHQNQPLAGGRIRNGYIFCPLHGMRFDMATGAAVGHLTQKPVRVFETRIVDSDIQVLLTD